MLDCEGWRRTATDRDANEEASRRYRTRCAMPDGSCQRRARSRFLGASKLDRQRPWNAGKSTRRRISPVVGAFPCTEVRAPPKSSGRAATIRNMLSEGEEGRGGRVTGWDSSISTSSGGRGVGSLGRGEDARAPDVTYARDLTSHQTAIIERYL